MKKTLLFAFAFGLFLSTTSCKKTYNCECTTTTTIDGVVEPDLSVTLVYTGSEKCSTYEATQTVAGMVTKTTCVTK